MKSLKERKDKLVRMIVVLFGASGISFVLAFVLGQMMHSDDSFVETYLFPQAGEGSAVCFWLAFILLIIAIIMLVKKEDTIKKYDQEEKEHKKNQQKQEQQKIDAIKRDYDYRSKKMYNKYIKEGFDINDEETNQIVSKTYNLSIKEIIALYNHGMEVCKKEEETTLNNKRLEQNNAVMIEKNKAYNIFGKSKYLDVLYEKKEAFDTISQMSKIMSDSYISGASNARNVPKSDPYILGGMANGIAGPAAGIATAMDIQRKNAERELRGKQIAENSINQATKWSRESSKASFKSESIGWVISLIEESLFIDDFNKLKSKINFDNFEFKILDTNNFEVSVDYSVEEVNIINKKSILDGTFVVSIIDENGNEAATGYYNSPTVTVNDSGKVDTSSIGMEEKGSFTIICSSKKDIEISDDKKYEVKVEPMKLWAIEKKW